MKLKILAGAVLCLLTTAAQAQYRETTITIPDSFGGVSFPWCIVYDSTSNTAYFAGQNAPWVIRGELMWSATARSLPAMSETLHSTYKVILSK